MPEEDKIKSRIKNIRNLQKGDIVVVTDKCPDTKLINKVGYIITGTGAKFDEDCDVYINLLGKKLNYIKVDKKYLKRASGIDVQRYYLLRFKDA